MGTPRLTRCLLRRLMLSTSGRANRASRPAVLNAAPSFICISSRGLLSRLARSVRKFSRRIRPRGKRIRDALEHRRQLGEMAQQYGRHVVVVDPIETGFGVDGFVEVVGEEAVAL